MAYDDHWESQYSCAAQVEFSRASVCRMCLDTGFSYNKYEREFMPDR